MATTARAPLAFPSGWGWGKRACGRGVDVLDAGVLFDRPCLCHQRSTSELAGAATLSPRRDDAVEARLR